MAKMANTRNSLLLAVLLSCLGAVSTEAAELYRDYLRETPPGVISQALGDSPKKVDASHQDAQPPVVAVPQNDQAIVTGQEEPPAAADNGGPVKVESVAAVVFANPGDREQNSGTCDWFPPANLEILLGKNITVRQLAALHCLAQSDDGASLALTSPAGMDASAFRLMQESYASNCTCSVLRELGEQAFAYFDCKTTPSMVIVELFKNGKYLNLAYVPQNDRPASNGDVEALKPLLRHIYNAL